VTIGLDLDNTIVCYDESLHSLAVELYGMPPSVPAVKTAVRQFFRDAARHRDWTALQGVAYGARMAQARAFPGAIEFVRQALVSGHDVFVASHRTRHPVIGEPVDLHDLARRWLQDQGLVGALLADDRVFFEETRQAKVERIARTDCDVFLDDLPEVLTDPAFPAAVSRYLFAPHGMEGPDGVCLVRDWLEFGRRIL
jgi:hypothetical protein